MANIFQRMLQRLIGYNERTQGVRYDVEIHDSKTEVVKDITRQELPRIDETYHITLRGDYSVVDVKHYGTIFETDSLEERTLVSKKNPLVVLHPKKHL